MNVNKYQGHINYGGPVSRDIARLSFLPVNDVTTPVIQTMPSNLIEQGPARAGHISKTLHDTVMGTTNG